MVQTLEQKDYALRRANEIRLERAKIKQAIRRGELSAADVVVEVTDATRNWRPVEILVAVERYGPARSRRLLAEVPVGEQRTIGEMTERQRRRLADLIRRGRP